jgi:N-acetylneuraminic acid mutarotase
MRGSRPSARYGHTCTAISDSRMLIFGGAGDDDDGQLTRFNTVHIFDISMSSYSLHRRILHIDV